MMQTYYYPKLQVSFSRQQVALQNFEDVLFTFVLIPSMKKVFDLFLIQLLTAN